MNDDCSMCGTELKSCLLKLNCKSPTHRWISACQSLALRHFLACGMNFIITGVGNFTVHTCHWCLAEPYFSPIVGLGPMVDLNLAHLLKGEHEMLTPALDLLEVSIALS